MKESKHGRRSTERFVARLFKECVNVVSYVKNGNECTANINCKVEPLGYFQLLDILFDDRNAVTERVSTTFLQLYLIWTPA